MCFSHNYPPDSKGRQSPMTKVMMRNDIPAIQLEECWIWLGLGKEGHIRGCLNAPLNNESSLGSQGCKDALLVDCLNGVHNCEVVGISGELVTNAYGISTDWMQISLLVNQMFFGHLNDTNWFLACIVLALEVNLKKVCPFVFVVMPKRVDRLIVVVLNLNKVPYL